MRIRICCHNCDGRALPWDKENGSDLDDRGWDFIFYFVGPTYH
jgi:hypothetical protein